MVKKGLGSFRSWVDERSRVKDDGERNSWVLIVYFLFFLEEESCPRREKRKFVGGEGTSLYVQIWS